MLYHDTRILRPSTLQSVLSAFVMYEDIWSVNFRKLGLQTWLVFEGTLFTAFQVGMARSSGS